MTKVFKSLEFNYERIIIDDYQLVMRPSYMDYGTWFDFCEALDKDLFLQETNEER